MIAAVRVPDFYLQAWLRLNADKAGVPLALIESCDIKGVARLISVNALSRQHGVRAGMTVAQAQALLDCIEIVARCVQAEEKTLMDLSDALWGRSPQVKVSQDEMGWAYAGLRGMGRLFGDVSDWVHAVLDDLVSLGLKSVIGVAPGWQQARLLALAGGGISSGSLSLNALKGVPCGVLEPSRDLERLFLRLGMRTVGDFLNVPAADVLEHMGEEAFLKYQIARGQEPAGPLAFEQHSVGFVEEEHFENALADLNALYFVLNPMLSSLLKRLSARGYHCRGLHLFFSYDGKGSEERTIEAGHPTRCVKTLAELCRLDLSRAPPLDSVGFIRMKAEYVQVKSSQLDLFQAVAGPDEKLSLTLARLEGIFGRDYVGSPRFVESYREDVFVLTPFRPREATAKESRLMPATLCLRRFRPPVHAEVLCRGQVFARFSMKGFSGRIRQWHGPYRICAEWWNEHESADGSVERGFFGDVYDLEVQDRIYRVCWNHRHKSWQALGWYD